MDNFDEYEKDILASYERGEWISVDNLEEKKKEYALNAKHTLKILKDQEIQLPEIQTSSIV